MIGSQLKHVFKGYDAWIISYHDECFNKIGLKPAICINMMNGSLECEYRKYEIFEGKYNDFKRETGGFKEKKKDSESTEFKKRQKSVYLIEIKNLSPKQRPVSERKKTISRNSRKIRENGKTAAFPNGMEKKP